MEPFPHPIRTEWKLLCQLKKDNPSITQEECAKQLGVNANTIRYWTRNPLYQSFENWFLEKEWERTPIETRRRREEVQEELDEFAQEMLTRLKDIVETSHDTKIVAQIGFDILDRAGYGAAKKEASRPINFVLTGEAIAELARRASDVRDDTPVLVGQAEKVV